MVDKNKLSKDFEEQIQSLAGDIYIQVEDKVASLIMSLNATQELTDGKVEQHSHYVALKESQQILQTELDQAKITAEEQLTVLKKEKEQLNEKLTVNEAEIKNLKEINGSKLSDSEILLKAKLDEISILDRKLAAFIKQEPETINKIAIAEKQIKELIENKNKLEHSEALLIKSDSAKVVALDLQSKQISDLQLQVNNANSELEQLQLEQSKLLESKAANSGEEKKQATQLNEKITQLNEQLKLAETKQKQTIASDEQQHKKVEEFNEKIVQLNEQLKLADVKQKQVIDSDQQHKKTILALNKEQDALIAIIATHKEEELAIQENLKQQGVEADSSKQKIDKLTVQLEEEQQKLAEQSSQLQSLKHESSEQGKNQLAATDKVIALELANEELQKQHTAHQEEKQIDHDKLLLVAKDYQEKITKLTDKLSVDEKRFITDSQLLKDSQAALEVEKQKLQQQLSDLSIKLESSEADLVTEKSGAGQYQENLTALEEKLKAAKSEQGNAQQRIDSAKAKFNSDSDQARETIKYLRDENHEITTQYEQRVGELEDKLTEYRLRFEYAQRQLAKNED